jgi:hypothetical protein
MHARPPRYGPGHPWPDYPFLPGRDPHPTRDPEGHSFEDEEPTVAAPDPRHWRDNEAYLHGTDLYNAGFHWEAHEAWESIWHAATEPLLRELLQALIQAAAAGVQQRLGREQGRQRLARRAASRLRHVAGLRGKHWMGVELEHFAAALENFAERGGIPPHLWLGKGTH